MATDLIGSNASLTDFTPLTNYLGSSFGHLDESLKNIASILIKIANKPNSEASQSNMISIGENSTSPPPAQPISKSVHDFRSTVYNSRPRLGGITNVSG